jgi:hypothetical protein
VVPPTEKWEQLLAPSCTDTMPSLSHAYPARRPHHHHQYSLHFYHRLYLFLYMYLYIHYSIRYLFKFQAQINLVNFGLRMCLNIDSVFGIFYFKIY